MAANKHCYICEVSKASDCTVREVVMRGCNGTKVYDLCETCEATVYVETGDTARLIGMMCEEVSAER